MQVGFIKFLGQDSAYVFAGTKLEAIRAIMNDDSITEAQLYQMISDGEIAVRTMEFSNPSILAVGDMC